VIFLVCDEAAAGAAEAQIVLRKTKKEASSRITFYVLSFVENRLVPEVDT
jgi:hypothetical protein